MLRGLSNLGEEGRLLLQFIGGKAGHGHGPHFNVLEPRSGQLLTGCSSASEQDVDSAVSHAAIAQKKWAACDFLTRGDVLRKTADIMKAKCEELAQWECRDSGKPIYEARMDVMSCVDTFNYFAGAGQSLVGNYVPLSSGRFAYTTKEPLGVVGCVGAWNYPVQTCSWKAAPALVCGNAVVYKPSPLTPISAVLLGKVLQEAGLPDGVFNVIQGGADVGKTLIEHPLIKKVSFTGSIPTGKSIMTSCAARNIKPVTLELGGKSSLIICEDAELDDAVAGAMMANFFSQGQVCSNASKVLVHESILPEFQEKLVARTKRMTIGDPFDESTRVGAHASEEHRQKVEDYIQDAVSSGTKILCGGERVGPSGLEDGFYVSPCILSEVTPAHKVYREEIFGSVLLLIPYKTEEEAIKMANDTSMGLAGGVFTRDLSKAYRIASKIEAGNIYVNTYNDVSPFVPFGGYNQSGFGRENGTAVLEHYTQIKSVFVNASSPLDNPF